MLHVVSFGRKNEMYHTLNINIKRDTEKYIGSEEQKLESR